MEDKNQSVRAEERGRGCAETTEPRTNSRGEKNAKAEEKLDKQTVNSKLLCDRDMSGGCFGVFLLQYQMLMQNNNKVKGHLFSEWH